MANLKEISFDNLDTSETTSMSYMFFKCSSLTNLDLNSFDTSNVTSMWNMFDGCINLTNIYVSSLWNTSAVTSGSSTNMFRGDTKLPNFNSSYVDKTNAHYNTGGYLTYKA